MAQFARPDEDVALDGWTNPSWSVIDEEVASDLDKTVSPTAPANATLVVGLSAVEDPAVATGHHVRFRYQKNVAGGATVNLSVRLLQTATEIVAWTYSDIANGWTDADETLTELQANAITDYTALRLEFKANQV